MNDHAILIIGAGRIGTLSALLLEKANYKVFLGDNNLSSHASHKNIILLDIHDKKSCEKTIKKNRITTVVCCLPYFQTFPAFEMAQAHQLHYFDLTEDTAISHQIRESVKKNKSMATVVMPQCGLAPGWVGILTRELASQFEELGSVSLRVGGLPQYAHNALHYGITWSIEGLINQYGNTCEAIERGKRVLLKPLEDVEALEIDGMLYEAFNTSGGLGNLIELYKNKLNYLNYKTIRYPGHAEKMRFLMNDLKLNEHRKTLEAILKNVLPEVHQDVVIMDITVSGIKAGKLEEQSIVKKYYPQHINRKVYSALQVTTAASVCAAIDIVLHHPKQYKGLQYQETIALKAIQQSTFAKYLDVVA